MALNLDTAIRLSAQVKGLDQFKALADRLLGVKSGSESASGAVQQLSGESTRLGQEAVKAASGVKVQGAALQDLQAKTRASGAEARRTGSEFGSLGGVFQRLRSQSAGVLDGVTQSSGKAANGIREFQRTIQLTDGDLVRMREQQLQLAASSKTTELSLKQQAEALKRLREHAEVGGGVYKALSGDIARLQAANKGLDGAAQQSSQSIAQQIQSLTALQASLQRTGHDFGATGQQINALKQRAAELGQAWEPGIRGLKLLGKATEEMTSQQSSQMDKLKGVLAQAGEGYKALGQQIQDLKAKAAGLDLSKGLTVGNVAQGTTSAIQSIVQMRRDLAKSMTGRVLLTGEGLATAGVAGAAGMGAASGLGGLAGGAQSVASSLDAIAAKAAALPGLLKPLGGLLSEPAAAAAGGIADLASNLTAAQAKLAALSAPFEAIGTAISAIGPEASAAAGVASLAIAGVYQVLSRQADEAQADLERSFKGISDSAQEVLQNLTRLYDKVPAARLAAQEELRQRNLQRLGELPSDSVEARRAANAVATAEREIERIQIQQQNLLERARGEENRRTDAVREQINLARQRLFQQQAETRLAQEAYNWEWLRNREAAARTRASSGNSAAVQDARLRLEDQRRATAEAQSSRNWEWLRNRESRAKIGQDEALMARSAAADAAAAADLRRRAAAAFPAPTTLALPAAGQTSFQGAIDSRGFGGGARARVNSGETPLIMATDRPSRQAFRGGNDYAGPGFGINSNTANATTQAAGRTRGALAELFLTIDRVTSSSNGSINSLQRQRSAWEALRNAVNPAAPAYAKATREVEALDKRLQALTATQQKQERQGIGREVFGSAIGSLAAGGGFQGAVGALAGGLAFSGGPAGIAAGAGISAALGVGALASRVGVDAEMAQVRLKALTDQFGEYNQAQAAAARIASTLRISTVEAQDSFGKLYAALRPTGVTLQEVEDAFIGFTAAARASGATAQESSYALLQLKQALGSGILQGDELRSIREQAPAVGQAIAKEMGVTIGELKKLGEQGKITTDIVLRALAKLKGEKLDQLNEQFNTSAQAIKDLQIATENFGRIVAQVFGPTAVALLKGFTFALQGVNAAATDAANALTKPKAYAAEVSIRQGRLPMGIDGAAELFKGSSGTGGVGLTGLIAEAKELSRMRRQPYNDVLLKLMQDRLNRLDTQQQGGTTLQQQERDAAAGERSAPRRRAAAAAAEDAAKKAEKNKPSVEERIAARPFGRQIIAAARANSLDPALLAAVVSQESGGNPRAISRSGAIGLTQLMPGTARELGVNPYDPLQNLMGGARYLRQQISRFGLEGGLRAYNQGPGAQMRTPSGNSRESREYPGKVLARYRQLTGGEGDLTGMDTEALQARIEEQKRIQEILRSRTAEIDLLGVKVNLEDQIAQAQGQGDQLLARRLQGEQNIVDVQSRYTELLADPQNQDAQIQELLTRQGLLEVQAEQLRTERELQDLQRQRAQEQMQALQQYIEKQYELNTAVQQQKAMAESISGTIGQGMTSAFDVLISGAENWGESLKRIASEALVEIANQLIRIYVIEQAVSAIKSFLSPFSSSTPIGAGGGQVGKFGTLGPNYGIRQFEGGGFTGYGSRSGGIDGRGGFPAILHPNETVIDHTRTRAPAGGSSAAPITVNVSVDATGSKVQGDAGNSQQLGRAVAAAVQAELVRQKRPGGLLAS
jgi:tape measure domain-containing protein